MKGVSLVILSKPVNRWGVYVKELQGGASVASGEETDLLNLNLHTFLLTSWKEGDG